MMLFCYILYNKTHKVFMIPLYWNFISFSQSIECYRYQSKRILASDTSHITHCTASFCQKNTNRIGWNLCKHTFWVVVSCFSSTFWSKLYTSWVENVIKLFGMVKYPDIDVNNELPGIWWFDIRVLVRIENSIAV